MTEKVFEGQYNGEKILLRTRPHIMYYFMEKFPIFLLYLVIAILISVIGIWAKPNVWFLFILFSIIVLIIFALYFKWMYKSIRYTFTSRRCIKLTRRNIFKRGYREIHLVDLVHAIPKKAGFFGMTFGYGNLVLIDKDEKKVTYRGIKEQRQVSRYLGRIIDYIKINGHTDDISVYQPKKVREQLKKYG